MVTCAELLDFLSARGGREFRVTALLRAGRGRKATVRELGEYRLTLRGDHIRATGPSGQTRDLSHPEFLALFGTYVFTPAAATGVLTDLGPLFAQGDHAGTARASAETARASAETP